METQKSCWIIEVTCDQILTVVFNKPVTAQEAKALFNDDEYADIIDEEVHHYREIKRIR